MDIKTEKAYKISKIVIPVLSFLILSIMGINEESDWIIISIILSTIIFGFCFPSTWMSKKIIKTGNKINNKFLRICYYIIFLPIIDFILFYLLYAAIIFGGYKIFTRTTDMGKALGQAFTILFFGFIVFVCIFIPYIQSIIVIILKYFLKEKK